MKPGELYKPVGYDCVLLCVGPDTFTVEAGASPFHAEPEDPMAANGEYPLGGKITFSPTPPMHRAWHWSDLVTEADAQRYKSKRYLKNLIWQRYLNLIPQFMPITFNKNFYIYENNL